MTSSTLIRVTDQSGVAEARRLAAGSQAAPGLGEPQRANLAIVVTELATNLLKHAGGGSIVVQTPDNPGEAEVFALDRGRGIADLKRAMQDGVSSAGSPGTGLGAISRLSSQMEVFSAPDLGTAIRVHIGAGPRPRKPDREAPPFEVGGICVAKAGEEVCGDAWCIDRRAGSFSLLVIDGLGHGIHAREAALMGVDIFRKRSREQPALVMEAIHAALRSTRGAAAAIADADPSRGTVRYAGLGNVSGSLIVDGVVRHMVSQNGTAGQGTVQVREFTYPWNSGTLLLMHTDGLQTRWDLGRYPGLLSKHPGLIAAVLYRDFERGRDDCTVVGVREAAP